MDLRQLEMFRAVAGNSSFTLAAGQLHVAQSAISRKIRLLEEELGEKLFRRANKRIFITPAGETMMRYANRIFQELHNATVEIADAAGKRSGILRIGGGMTACMYVLPPVIEEFQKHLPKIDVQVVTGTAETLISQIHNAQLDVGVLTLPIGSQDLEVIPFAKEEMVLVSSPRNRRLAKRRTVRASELAKFPMIVFSRGTSTRLLLDQYFERLGISPKIAMESENVATIKPLVRINLGVSLLPLRSVIAEARRGELHYIRIRDEKIVREIGLVCHKVNYKPKALDELIALFRKRANPSHG
jgi:DNA-binding transcriptional LysR family regulator